MGSKMQKFESVGVGTTKNSFCNWLPYLGRHYLFGFPTFFFKQRVLLVGHLFPNGIKLNVAGSI